MTRAAAARQPNRSNILLERFRYQLKECSLLETVTKRPLASWLSIRVISWLKRLRMDPVSVVEKKESGALLHLDVFVHTIFSRDLPHHGV